MKKLKIEELSKLFSDGESADKGIFAEMRSNVLLHIGDHYKKTQERLLERMRESRSSEAVKLKLTKNHIQVITKDYINGIVSQAPGVAVIAYNENELQDEKDAELSQAVWRDAEDKQNVDEKIDKWSNSFVVVGEMASKIYFDPNKGKQIGWKQAVNDQGQPLFQDPSGGITAASADIYGQPLQPAQGDIPVFEGELVIKVIHPFNLIRDKGAETLAESRFLAIRTMVPVEEAKALIAGHPEREKLEKFVLESSQTTFKVFDSTSGEYQDSKGQVLLKEFYFRPCVEYPNGYYYITAGDSDGAVLFDGELPFGIFPIITEGFDEVATSPRGRSIIKPLRAPQAEINRMASMISTTQITLGDDKIFTVTGSKVSRGASFAGLREFQVAGPTPQVFQGRAGDQFEASLAREVNEIYKLANLEYEQRENQGTDPYAMLYRSLAQRKKYVLYVRKFERFLCSVAKTYLRLAKRYYSDERIIRAVGRREAINIAEFKNIKDDGFNIKVKPMSNDIESMMGKQLNINSVIQYVGKDLPPHIQGMIIKSMPFLNKDKMFNRLTQDSENIDSVLLALDRGQFLPARPTEKHELFIEALNHRMNQSDYMLLPSQVQEMYNARLQQHVELKAQQAAELKAAQSEFIPTGGALITCSLHIPDPEKPGQTKQLRVPYESLMRLVQMLDSQGATQDQLELMDQQNQVQVLQAAQRQQPGIGMPAGVQQPMPMPQLA